MSYNYNSDIWSRIRPKIQQWESVTGRTVPPSMLRSFMEAELNTEANRADKIRALDIQESSRKDLADVANRRLDMESKANAVSGIADLATGGLGAYSLGKEAGLWGAKTPTAGMGATTMGTAGNTLMSGAQTQLAPTTAWNTPGLAASVMPEATTGAELATTTSAPAVSSSISGSLAPIGLASTALGVGAGMLGKAITGYGREGHMGGERYTSAGIGAAGGAAAGFAVGGPIGAIIGGVTGLVGGGTVICTELNRQGYLPDEVLECERQYVDKFIDSEVYQGYRIMADPVVRLMQKSKVFTKIVKPLGCAFAYEMAHRVNESIKGSKLGKMILKIGIPLCKIVARNRRIIDMEVV